MVGCGNGNGKWHVGVRWVFARLRAVGAYMQGERMIGDWFWKCYMYCRYRSSLWNVKMKCVMLSHPLKDCGWGVASFFSYDADQTYLSG